MAKKNHISRISLAGGIIGALTTNPRKALQNELDRLNSEGWEVTFIQPHSTHNMLIIVLQLLLLAVTLGLYTWGGGYLILAEQDS